MCHPVLPPAAPPVCARSHRALSQGCEAWQACLPAQPPVTRTPAAQPRSPSPCVPGPAGALLDHAGGYIDPLRVVSQIPPHMKVGGVLAVCVRLCGGGVMGNGYPRSHSERGWAAGQQSPQSSSLSPFLPRTVPRSPASRCRWTTCGVGWSRSSATSAPRQAPGRATRHLSGALNNNRGTGRSSTHGGLPVAAARPAPLLGAHTLPWALAAIRLAAC